MFDRVDVTCATMTPVDRTQIRERLRSQLLDMARADPRVVGSAVVGSLVDQPGDKWSDLDLTFAVTDKTALEAVLDEWTEHLVRNFEATSALDLWRGETVYRVFFLPGCVQIDLSFTPEKIPATSPRFKLLFGESHQVDVALPAPSELFGWTLMWAWSARVSIERNKPWMAEYCISQARNSALEMACVRLGVPAQYGKGLDQLPSEIAMDFEAGLALSLEIPDLKRTLRAVVEAAGREADRHEDILAGARERLKEVLSAD